MTSEPIVDADVIPDEPHDVSGPSTALARRVTHEVIRPLATEDVVSAMQSHQELLRAILNDSDWQGAPNAKGSFVKKSGWRKIALAYNLSIGRVGEDVERGDDGAPLRATYTAWAEAPNGRRVEATGHCSFNDSRFSGPRGNVSKLENGLRATAETRAKNRAISDLIDMGKVSAEEIDAGAGAVALAPLPDAERAIVFNALGYILSPLSDSAAGEKDTSQVAAAITAMFDGVFPQKVGQAITAIAGRRQRLTKEAQGEAVPT